MKFLMLDNDGEGMGVDLALRAEDAGHDVRYWVPTRNGEQLPYGQGLLNRPLEWESSMDWAELVVLTGNSTYAGKLAPYFGNGYPIFGANAKASELELDRAKGQEVLDEAGVKTIPYEVVDSLEEATKIICETGQAYAMKPWGGDADKSMTCVASTPEEALFTLQKWEKQGQFKGSLMMQERVKGVEIGVSCFFGPGGWAGAIEESFEHKKLMNKDLGPNTGEMGTVIRHVRESKLFDMLLAPITEYLHQCNYIGDCSINCIVDKKGIPWPLEFTMRLGWPDFCIRQEVIQGDPIQWMFDLLRGEDSMEVSDKTAIGVLIAHGDFPACRDAPEVWSDFPISGLSKENYDHVHFQQVKRGVGPKLVGGKVKETRAIVTAGPYVMIVGGTGRTVRGAQQAMYDRAWEIDWPSDLMFRTDVGDRLEEDLMVLQPLGFATGMKW